MNDLNHVLYYQGKQAVLDLIHNSRENGVPSVTNISDIKRVDIEEKDGIYTGINLIDSLLMRLFEGTLTVVSGESGAGKTSFVTQLICESMEQGKPVWLFSKEMSSEMSKAWIDHVLAGKQHLKEYRDEAGARYYKIPHDIEERIDKYADRRCYIYKDNESNKIDDLIVSMTDCSKKYGTRFFVVDNMMMLEFEDDKGELKQQTETVNKLILFALKMQATVLLVCHPRKLPREAGGNMKLSDVSGSSNIGNLAHRTIGIRKIDHESGQAETDKDVLFTILKDRFTGKEGKKIGLYYDFPSRRFYSNKEELFKKYSWDRCDEGKDDEFEYPHADESEIYGEVVQ
jgi:KaiC/GvpD/RAD55 family RecA-like ATPase